MMKNVLLSMVAMLLFIGSVNAKPVDVGKARRVAETYMNAKGMKNVSALQNVTAQTPFSEFYVFVAPTGGFILVSADDCVMPVLGYSVSCVFNTKEIPSHVQDKLEGYEQEIRHWKRQEARRHGLETGKSAVTDQWRKLATGEMPPASLTTAVSPLLTTTWGQQPLYNDLCPFDTAADTRAITGCVATATAQIMKYYNHPTTGYGSHSYQCFNDSVDFGTLSANFGATTYQWANMPNELNSMSSSDEVNAVATLMYHVGVADEMGYDIARRGGSSAYNNNVYGVLQASSQSSLMAYFKYRPDMIVFGKEDYSDSEYCSRLRAEIDQQRPILYSGRDYAGGHSFILHGYDNNGLFYVNWGWRGIYDGYYAMGALNPGEGGDGGNATYTFNESNVALVGVRPNTDWSTTGTTTITTSSTSSFAAGSVLGAGTYNFGDTIPLTAFANEGYRFTGWTDGDRSNPRYMIATGGSYSFTANFAFIQGDTIGYCSSTCRYITRYGVSNEDYRWGIRLPSSVLPQSRDLTAAELYVSEAGTYTLQIFTGTDTPTTLAGSSEAIYIDADNVQQWHTFPLTSPVILDGSQNVWITFTCADAMYPASVTYWGGGIDGFCFGDDMHYYSNQCSFMIHGIFSAGTVAEGDTISYCNNTPFASGLGTISGDNLYWGIMLPPTATANHNYLKSVMLYVRPGYPGTYTLNVYTGGDTVPDSLSYTRPMTFGVADTGWQEILIHTTFPIPSQNLWITFKTTGMTLPMSACAYTGSPNSDWISLDDTSWIHCTELALNYSWMIKAVTSSTVPPADTSTYTITILANNENWGCVMDFYSGTYMVGDEVMLFAVGGTCTGTELGHFVRWSDGDSNQFRTVTVFCDATYMAIFEPDVCLTISEFPYQWGFDGTLGCWTAIDSNDDNSTWHEIEVMPHSGIGVAASLSFAHNPVLANEYLVSPQIQIPADHSASISWWFMVDGDYPEDKLALKVSTTGSTAADFTTTLFDITPTAVNGDWTQQTVDLSAYAGQNIYLAFHHHDSYDNNYLFIDDVKITATSNSQPTTYTVSVLANDNMMGTVTGSGTYPADTVITITALPNSGYHFVQWDDNDPNASRTVTVLADTTYIAIFAPDGVNPPQQYTVTVLASDSTMGTVTGGGTYPADTVITITALPNSDYHFVQWDDNDTNATRTVTVTADATYIATFAPDGINPPQRYTVTVNRLCNCSENIPADYVTGEGTYDSAATVTLQGTVHGDEFSFEYWITEMGDTIVDNPYVFTISSDRTVTAVFGHNGGIDDMVTTVVTLYPNPATDKVTLFGLVARTQVTLIDALGRQCGSWETSESPLTLDVSRLARGPYLLRIVSDGKVSAKKLVVE